MTDHQLAFVRTLQPVLFGSAIGIGAYFMFNMLSATTILAIGTALAFGTLIWFTVLIYKMNLNSVRREREQNK